MSLLTAELRKVWGNRVFPMLLAVLVAANLLLLWMGTRPTANQPPPRPTTPWGLMWLPWTRTWPPRATFCTANSTKPRAC